MSTLSPGTEGASPACWSQPGGKASQGSWNEESHDNWSRCDNRQWSKVPVPLLLLLLCLFCIHRYPITPYVLSLAMAGSTFLLSITITLGIFSVSESFCHQLGSWGVTAGLKDPILFAFTATVSSLTALSAVTALFCFPVLLCALLWLLSFLLTATLHCCPLVPMALVMSCPFSELSLTCSALALLARLLCCSWKQLPGNKVPVPLLLLLLCLCGMVGMGLCSGSLVHSSAHPLIYFLAGSCAKELTPSVSVAFQRAFEALVPEAGNRDSTRGSSSSGIIMKERHHKIKP
uniref:Uncharacterized protein n=1 Tax=Zonotrichia albicollis TaxID=44394 RepID=A0A8D2QAA6_ZONAL